LRNGITTQRTVVKEELDTLPRGKAADVVALLDALKTTSELSLLTELLNALHGVLQMKI